MNRLRNNANQKEQRRYLRKNQTDAERKLWSILRKSQLQGFKFYRQYSVGSYILDFYCPAKRLCVEVDGGQHAEEGGLHHDALRTRYLSTKGIRTIRVWNNEVLRNPQGVWEEIIHAIQNHNSP